tara:strand:- start:301 stop:528 length:228 start_codon:yes stop_codon:yes gene_type:complete
MSVILISPVNIWDFIGYLQGKIKHFPDNIGEYSRFYLFFQCYRDKFYGQHYGPDGILLAISKIVYDDLVAFYTDE